MKKTPLVAALLALCLAGCKLTDYVHWPSPPPGPVVPAPAPQPPDNGAPPPPPVDGNPVPAPPDAGSGAGADAIDLKAVTWVHARGQDLASWPITASLGAVEFRLPMVCSSGMSWPTTWTPYGEKQVTANHIVLAQISGKWYGGAWEAMYRNVAPCRVLEVLRDGIPGLGPFAQVEQSPFWDWYPQPGERICFLVTSWIRSSVLQPVGRSRAVCTVWP